MSAINVVPFRPVEPPHPYTPLQSGPLPPPVRRLESELRLGLFTGAGAGTLMSVFGRPQTIQLELALETLVSRMSPTWETDVPETALRVAFQAAAVASGQLRLCAQARHPESQRLATASRETRKALRALSRCGAMATNATALLHHLQLHLSLPDPARRGRRSGSFLTQLRSAQMWARDSLSSWRSWSDNRFGPVQCLEWDPDGHFCKRVGYSFNGESYELHYLRDRIWHQQREWNALARGPLAPAVRAHNAWIALQQRLNKRAGRATSTKPATPPTGRGR